MEPPLNTPDAALTRLPTDKLVFPEDNPRTIDRAMFEKLKTSMRLDPDFSEVRPIIVNMAPGREYRVIAGSMRGRAAQELRRADLPAFVVHVDEATERAWQLKDNLHAGSWQDDLLAESLYRLQEAGASLDALCMRDDEVDRLLRSVMGGMDPRIEQSLLQDLEALTREQESLGDPLDDADAVPQSRDAAPAAAQTGGDEGDAPAPKAPDIIWPSDNAWGVPALDPDMQATELIRPVALWGAKRSRKAEMRGTYLFYTEDYRFSAIWQKPQDLLESGAKAAAEVNYSCFADTPRAEALYRVYKKRWLSRYWQSKGVRIWVDLTVDERHEDLNLLGVPKSWRAFSVRGYDEFAPEIERAVDLAARHAGTDKLLVLLYGGSRRIRELAERRAWLWVPEDRDTAKGKFQDGEVAG